MLPLEKFYKERLPSFYFFINTEIDKGLKWFIFLWSSRSLIQISEPLIWCFLVLFLIMPPNILSSRLTEDSCWRCDSINSSHGAITLLKNSWHAYWLHVSKTIYLVPSFLRKGILWRKKLRRMHLENCYQI